MTIVPAIPVNTGGPPISVTIRFASGQVKTGTLRSFDPSATRLNFKFVYTKGNNKKKDMTIKVDPKEISYVAFRHLNQQNKPPDVEKMGEFDIHLVGGTVFSVKVDTVLINHSVGFYGYPLASQSQYQAFYFFNHAVQRRVDKEPLGSLLVKEGLADAESIDRGLKHQAEAQNPPIGQILIEHEVIMPEDVETAADRQARLAKQGRPMRLGEILVEAELATDEDIQRALKDQKKRKGKRLGEVLVDLGIVKEKDVALTLAKKFSLPFVDLDDEVPSEEAFEAIPASLVEKYRVFPYRVTNKEIFVALADPLSMEPLDMLRFSITKKIVEVMVLPSQLDRYIRTYFSGGGDGVPEFNMDEIMAELHSIDGGSTIETDNQDFIEAGHDDSAVAKLVNRIIMEGHRREASDIHVEPYGTSSHTVVRFRIDGVCSEFQKIPAANRKQVVARIKIMANLDITERRLPQDGKIRFRIGKRTVELRVATIPTVNDNEDVVLRILAGAGALPLKQMNFHPKTFEKLEWLVKRPYGMLLAVGPTGSGKTTTLHALVGHINDNERKIWTAEDPVEITQYGLRQVQVKPKIGFTFASAMRAFLRADPDVILVGEMRDLETASIGVEASLTGHLVLSTLHTNSAVETITRLVDMGLDPFSFSDALLGVLAQRLARRLCTKCRQSYEATKEELAELAHFVPPRALEKRLQGKPLTLWRSPGCEYCNDKGYKGRLGIHELLVVDEHIREAVQSKATVDEILTTAKKGGMQTLLEDGINKAIEGLTDLQKVLAVCSR